MKRIAVIAAAFAIAAVGLSIAVAMSVLPKKEPPQPPKTPATTAAPAPTGVPASGSGRGLAAIAEAAQAQKYLFAFFWKTESPETTAARAVFAGAAKNAADRAQAVEICIADAAERGIVDKFELDRAPMPLVLAIAPNGAVMGGFPQTFSEADLLGAFGSPCLEQCMKTLQEGNLVLLCVQNATTKANDEALRGVRDFAADARYANATQVVMLDPADPAEQPFLTDLKIEPTTAEAVTAFLVPPGAVVAEFKSATSKDDLIAALASANTGCGPGGCGPGGCAPKQ